MYPFRQTVANPDVTWDDAIEKIDIGGPTMIRAAAKNQDHVAVVVDPADYDSVIEEMKENGGGLSKETRRRLAVKVYSETCDYDGAIVNYLAGQLGQDTPPVFAAVGRRVAELRYGENPHQKAAFYVSGPGCLSDAEQISGKELSFNNYLDLHAAATITAEFEKPFAVVIKHTNPCGAACGDTLAGAYAMAYEGDPLSAFGSVVGVNRQVDEETAKEIATPGRFVEAVLAPSFSKEAVLVLTSAKGWGKSVRLLAMGDDPNYTSVDLRMVCGGLLLQDSDRSICGEITVPTKRKPTDKEMEELMFAWKICKNVKSNAIVVAKKNAVMGVGAGQMSRVDSTLIAIRKAGVRVSGTVLASDAFFPFPDAVTEAANAGVTAIIQPGGAKRDKEVISTCDQKNVAMVFSGQRHFRH